MNYKLGRTGECQRELQPLAHYATLPPEKLRERFAPIDAEMFYPELKATRLTLKLCNANQR
ncbi:MAG: hypothetical protein MO853_01035 [Candidatus Protistobacter heckmanni]|nr:hypothetical protein [Candidatus Protistobacter heckmanni]